MTNYRLAKIYHWITRNIAERKGILRPALALFWLTGFGLLVWLVWRYWDEIIPYLVRADFRFLAASAIGYIFSILTAVIGWKLILRPVAPGISVLEHARIYGLTLIARRLPGTLWYVGGRLILYANLGISRSFVALASGIEMVIFVVSGILVSLIFLPQFPNVGIFIAVLLSGAGIALWFSPNLIAYIIKRRGIEIQTATRRLDLASWILAYAANWLSGGFMVVCIIAAFTPVDLKQVPFILGAWAFSGALGVLTIFLPSAFGLVEISLSVLLSRIMPLPLAVVIAIVMRILTYIFDIILALGFTIFMRGDRIQPGTQSMKDG